MIQRRRKPASTARKKTTSSSRRSPRRSARKKKSRARVRAFIIILVLALVSIWIWKPEWYVSSSSFIRRAYTYITSRPAAGGSSVPQVVQRTSENYGSDVDRLAPRFKLSPEYLKALIILECSGKKDIKPRYERHVYHSLLKVKEKKLYKFENITYDHLRDATDEALRNMARSWGPFQIMGYKCILLDIQLKDLRGDNALYWGMKWIDMTYGDYVRQGRYRDAFHMHNTGSPYPLIGPPQTYDPKYVDNGLVYMRYFSVYPNNDSLGSAGISLSVPPGP